MTPAPSPDKTRKAECRIATRATVQRSSERLLQLPLQGRQAQAELGKACGDCHNDQDWKATADRFKHERPFPIAQRTLPVVKCSARYNRSGELSQHASDCLSCHKKDDKHQGQVGGKGESRHTDKRRANFDHGLSRPLTKWHVNAPRKGCETLRYKDAPRDCFLVIKEDKHKQSWACDETCHNAWRTV